MPETNSWTNLNEQMIWMILIEDHYSIQKDNISKNTNQNSLSFLHFAPKLNFSKKFLSMPPFIISTTVYEVSGSIANYNTPL